MKKNPSTFRINGNLRNGVRFFLMGIAFIGLTFLLPLPFFMTVGVSFLLFAISAEAFFYYGKFKIDNTFSLQRAQIIKDSVEKKDVSALKSLIPFITKQKIKPSHIRKNILVEACELALLQKEYDIFSALLKYDEKIAARVLKYSDAIKRPEERERLYDILENCFKRFMQLIPNMKYVNDQNYWDELHSVSLKQHVSIVYNNDGYLKCNPKKTALVTKGRSLKLTSAPKTPIGYNIFLPPSELINNVIVEVYGGLNTKDRTKESYKPSITSLDNTEKFLINHGTVIIKLNLPDLLKLHVHQLVMPDALHQEIHQCIHRFYTILRKCPEKLHPNLEKLKDKKIYLMGDSFGGRTTFRHAQLYTETFDGYISINGVISMRADSQSSTQWTYNPHLDPATQRRTQRVKRPLLALQAVDDNNVNLKSLFDFLSKFTATQKQDLVRLHLYSSSNSDYLTKKYYSNKGHSRPSKQTEFEEFITTILKFMNEGPQALPVFTDNDYIRETTLAYRFDQSATLQQKFCAYGFELALLNQHTVTDLESVWEREYQSLFVILSYIESLEKSSHRLKKTVTKLVQQDLTDDVVTDTLNEQTMLFILFMKEYYKFEFPRDFMFKNLWRTSNILNTFRKEINSLTLMNKAKLRYFLFALYIENPALIQEHFTQGLAEQASEQAKAKSALEAIVKTQEEVGFIFKKMPYYGMISLKKSEKITSEKPRSSDFISSSVKLSNN